MLPAVEGHQHGLGRPPLLTDPRIAASPRKPPLQDQIDLLDHVSDALHGRQKSLVRGQQFRTVTTFSMGQAPTMLSTKASRSELEPATCRPWAPWHQFDGQAWVGLLNWALGPGLTWMPMSIALPAWCSIHLFSIALNPRLFMAAWVPAWAAAWSPRELRLDSPLAAIWGAKRWCGGIFSINPTERLSLLRASFNGRSLNTSVQDIGSRGLERGVQVRNDTSWSTQIQTGVSWAGIWQLCRRHEVQEALGQTHELIWPTAKAAEQLGAAGRRDYSRLGSLWPQRLPADVAGLLARSPTKLRQLGDTPRTLHGSASRSCLNAFGLRIVHAGQIKAQEDAVSLHLSPHPEHLEIHLNGHGARTSLPFLALPMVPMALWHRALQLQHTSLHLELARSGDDDDRALDLAQELLTKFHTYRAGPCCAAAPGPATVDGNQAPTARARELDRHCQTLRALLAPGAGGTPGAKGVYLQAMALSGHGFEVGLTAAALPYGLMSRWLAPGRSLAFTFGRQYSSWRVQQSGLDANGELHEHVAAVAEQFQNRGVWGSVSQLLVAAIWRLPSLAQGPAAELKTVQGPAPEPQLLLRLSQQGSRVQLGALGAFVAQAAHSLGSPDVQLSEGDLAAPPAAVTLDVSIALTPQGLRDHCTNLAGEGTRIPEAVTALNDLLDDLLDGPADGPALGRWLRRAGLRGLGDLTVLLGAAAPDQVDCRCRCSALRAPAGLIATLNALPPGAAVPADAPAQLAAAEAWNSATSDLRGPDRHVSITDQIETARLLYNARLAPA